MTKPPSNPRHAADAPTRREVAGLFHLLGSGNDPRAPVTDEEAEVIQHFAESLAEPTQAETNLFSARLRSALQEEK